MAENLHYNNLAVNVQGITSGKEILDWYLGLFDALSTLGTLGAGFTLSVVVSGPPRKNAAGWKPSTITTLAAMSSILFVLTVLLSQGFSQLFKFQHKTITKGIKEPFIKRSLGAISLLLQVLVLTAFLFLELILTAYSPSVGWIGVGVTSVLAIIALGLWLRQAISSEVRWRDAEK